MRGVLIFHLNDTVKLMRAMDEEIKARNQARERSAGYCRLQLCHVIRLRRQLEQQCRRYHWQAQLRTRIEGSMSSLACDPIGTYR